MKKYNIVYADPAWSFGDKIRSSKKLENGNMHFRELGLHYSTMKTTEICALRVKDIVADDAALFLWTTDAHLPDALQVIDAWGFKYKTIAFIWNKKTNKGNQVCFMGKWTMKGSEICLLATKGKAHGLIKSHKVRQLVEAERDIHSRKPDEVRKRIVELLGDLPKVELFCRVPKDGWDIWGNEVVSTVVL
jgi:N6-adenosine-specific RNA methylase IME4